MPRYITHPYDEWGYLDLMNVDDIELVSDTDRATENESTEEGSAISSSEGSN